MHQSSIHLPSISRLDPFIVGVRSTLDGDTKSGSRVRRMKSPLGKVLEDVRLAEIIARVAAGDFSSISTSSANLRLIKSASLRHDIASFHKLVN